MSNHAVISPLFQQPHKVIVESSVRIVLVGQLCKISHLLMRLFKNGMQIATSFAALRYSPLASLRSSQFILAKSLVQKALRWLVMRRQLRYEFYLMVDSGNGCEKPTPSVVVRKVGVNKPKLLFGKDSVESIARAIAQFYQSFHPYFFHGQYPISRNIHQPFIFLGQISRNVLFSQASIFSKYCLHFRRCHGRLLSLFLFYVQNCQKLITIPWFKHYLKISYGGFDLWMAME